MREMPNFDDANFALKLYELRREPELRKARNLVGDVLDGASWEKVDEVRQYEHKSNAHFRQVFSYWEMVSSFVNRGILHPDVYLDTCGEALYTYSVMKPHIAKLRESGSPRFLLQTEKAISDHPALRERVETIDKMMEAYRAAEAAKAAAKASMKGKKPAAKPSAANAKKK